LGQALKNASRDAGGTRPRLREAVVAAQIALTFVLLVGAGLATRSFLSMMSRDLHFDTARLLTFEINFPPPDYMGPRGIVDGQRYFEIDPSPAPTFERVYDRVRQIPGAQSVAGTSTPLLTGLVIPEMRMIPDGIDDRAASASYFLVTPGFFTSLRAALIAGRDFTDTDRESSPWVAIVNESAARRFWPGENPIGRTVRLTSVREERPRQVVGVIRDIPLRLLELGDRAVVYSPYLQQPSYYPLPGANMMGRMAFMVRATADPRALIPAVREAVSAVVPDRPLANVGTLDAQMRFIIPQQDDFALVLSVFALTAALLAGIGIYGVTSYSVAQRTREIGVRMALGAGARSVMARVGYHALIIVVIGLAVGMATVIALLPALRSFVWGISPIDPMALLGAVASLLVVCGVGSLLPARRAAAVDPTVALRSE
jgi:predicted permease